MLVAIWWRVRQNLALNHRPEDVQLLPSFGPGNQLSLFRGLLLGLLAGFLFAPWPQGALAWVVAGLYTVVSIADGLDGYVARRSGQETNLGQWLDMEFDGLGVAIVSVLAVGYGQLPAWFLAIGFARYAFSLGLWLRRRTNQPVYALPPSTHRRILAGMLMAMMTVVLWPIVPAPMSQLAALVIGIPVLLGFLRDWLFVSGRLDASSQSYRRVQHGLYLLFARWLPLLWRLLLVLSMTQILTRFAPWYRPAPWQVLLESWGLPGAPYLASLLAVTAVIGTALTSLGILGRFFSILLLLPIGFDISTTGLTWPNGAALVCVLLIAFFGTGILSLWQPEEALMVPRGGKKANDVLHSDGDSDT